MSKKEQDNLRGHRLLLRLKCVKLVQSGKSASEVARLHGQSPRAVSYWVTRFKQRGVDGLNDTRTHSGRKPRLTSAQMKKANRFVKGFQTKSKPVTGIILSKYIRDTFGVTLTLRQCQRIIKALPNG